MVIFFYHSPRKQKREEGKAGAYPESGGSAAGAALLAGPAGKGRLHCAGLRRPPSALHRGSRSDFLFLGPGPAARPRPGPPLSAELRTPPAASGGSPRPASPRPWGEEGGEAEGERERERLSTWTCLWSAAKQSSQITAPGAGGI